MPRHFKGDKMRMNAGSFRACSCVFAGLESAFKKWIEVKGCLLVACPLQQCQNQHHLRRGRFSLGLFVENN